LGRKELPLAGEAPLVDYSLRRTLVEPVANAFQVRHRYRICLAGTDVEGRSILARHVGIDDTQMGVEATVDDRGARSTRGAGRQGESRRAERA
jgi:hypothetical protein